MKWVVLSIMLTAGLLVPRNAPAEVSFTGSYSRAEITEEETIESDGLEITYPKDQDDILEHLLPLISKHRKARSRAVLEESSVIREVVIQKEAQVANIVKSLLSRRKLSDSFSANYKYATAELESIIDGWEMWAGDFSQVHFYNQSTGAPFWNKKTKVLDFGETQYSFPEGAQMNLSILPPFIAKLGAGVDKLKIDVNDVNKFKWDIGLYSPPGVSAEASSATIAKLFPVLENLQHEVAKQLGSQWIRNYLIERMLQHEIETIYFNSNNENHHLVRGLARLYLFVFLNQVEKHRMPMLFPNLIHFPLSPDSPQQFLDLVETLDPFESITSGMETAANRVVMYGLLKASQQVDGDFFPLQALQSMEVPIPEGGFDPESFYAAISPAYPTLDKALANAAHEIARLMRVNYRPNGPDPNSGVETSGTSTFPDSYQKRSYGNLVITTPVPLLEATDFLGPTWQRGLKKTSKTLRERFDRKPVPVIEFGERDFAELRRYGIPAKKSDVEIWLLQTAASNNVEQAFYHLFEGNEVEIWFKEDLIKSLEQFGNTETFSLDRSTKEIAVNFSFTIPTELFLNASMEDLSSRYRKLKPPVFPIIIPNREIAAGTLEEKVAAIRKGDYVVEQIIAGAKELSPGELTGHSIGLMDESETFFIVVHEVVEGFLIQEIIASRDRRWFCDGLANLIAMRECDRRFGEGSGQRVLNRMFPPKISNSLAENVNLLSWPAVENSKGNIGATKGLEGAHYDFATRAMDKALFERDSDFIRRWIELVGKTRWIRTNSTTVIEAYDLLTNGDLMSILESITH